MFGMIRNTLTEIPIQMCHQPDAKFHLQHPDLVKQQLICGTPPERRLAKNDYPQGF